MGKVPGWVWVVLIIGLLVAPEALGGFFAELADGFQTAFGGVL